jgi:hypothetical protein
MMLILQINYSEKILRAFLGDATKTFFCCANYDISIKNKF